MSEYTRSFAQITSTTKGATSFWAPELIKAEAVKQSKETDVWAFGMTMFVSSKPLNRINYLSWGDRNYGLATYHIMAYEQNV